LTTPGSGDAVKGPASAVDNRVALFDSTTGKVIKQSVVALDGSGNISGLNNIVSGNYTPTTTNSTNVGASSVSVAHWFRLGDYVIVAGKLQIDPTSAGTATVFYLSLPIGSNFTLATDCNGHISGTNGAQYGCGYINADVANGRAYCEMSFVGTANSNVGYTFSYHIL
jgi:hypothetical protein